MASKKLAHCVLGCFALARSTSYLFPQSLPKESDGVTEKTVPTAVPQPRGVSQHEQSWLHAIITSKSMENPLHLPLWLSHWRDHAVWGRDPEYTWGFWPGPVSLKGRGQLGSLVTALSDLTQRLVITFGLDINNTWKAKSMIVCLYTATTLLFWFSEDCVNQKYLAHLQKGLVPANHSFNYRK